MKYLSVLFSLVLSNSYLNAQKIPENLSVTNKIFNYFTHEMDSIVYDIGTIFLMPSDSVNFKTQNQYENIIIDSLNGHYDILFKDKLLFKYELKESNVSGVGYCYYPFNETIAIQGQFKNGQLHGFILVQEMDGVLLEIMKFKKGKYIKHLYRFDIENSEKFLKKYSKCQTNNPLKNNGLIYH